jgi:uncharacterized protein (TIGR03435 family)
MRRMFRNASYLSTAVLLITQLSFEVAVIKPTPPGYRGGKFTTMQGAHQFQVRNYNVKDMIAAAYNLPKPAIIGGPAWIYSDAYDIDAVTSGDARPTSAQQMSMLRTLLTERFKLKTHHEQKELSVFELNIARDGIRLKQSAASPEDTSNIISRMFPNHVQLPARNVTMAEFVSELQSILGRPVLDKTKLSAKYDFDLEWARDDAQFGGALPPVDPNFHEKPDLFTAMQEQLGLRLSATKRLVEVVIVDSADRPSEN